MDANVEPAVRDRAILIVRLATFGGVASAVGLSWVFADLAEAYFSGKPAEPTRVAPPVVPVKAAPVQKPPTVIQKIVHHPYQGGGGTGGPAAAPVGAAPRPPASGPGPAPPPPPPPKCKSTPSKPC
jgi:hypothetical protein